MTMPNVTPNKLQKAEQEFRKLLHRFFKARGNLPVRQRLARRMRELREKLCVSWEQFVCWFMSTLSHCSRYEHEEAEQRTRGLVAVAMTEPCHGASVTYH